MPKGPGSQKNPALTRRRGVQCGGVQVGCKKKEIWVLAASSVDACIFPSVFDAGTGLYAHSRT